MVLARDPRLSVQPVSAAEWSKVCALGGLADSPRSFSAGNARPGVNSGGNKTHKGGDVMTPLMVNYLAVIIAALAGSASV